MVGIVDFDICLPTSYVSVQDMHAASGVGVEDIKKITHGDGWPVLGDHGRAWELACRAARAVLDRTAVRPEDIRQVIYAGSGEWDRPFWSPAAKVAHELGIERAHAYEVTNFCNAGMAALRIAADGIALGRGEYALVLVGDRLSRLVDYTDPGSKALFNYGDAAAAVLVSGRDVSFEHLHAEMRTDPGWSDYYAGEHRRNRVVIRRAAHRPGLADAYVENFTALVGDTLDALGRDVSDVAYFLINHGDRNMHRRLLETLGLPPEKSVFNYHRLGHMGGADTLIALQDLLTEKKLARGDLVLMASSAMGFSWGITALEFRA
ncbi:3-oxoacyl-ACP synthase III family protein [Streptomyces morookaense]|uniref:3-oxoacyl-ACP synthase n=1 Tax=Streptomyces morookaense TaxID=1970 RepID=A0A7Y7E6N1_STRMO|nr:3-oxoacyl-[acyl-carrier-protein] synthase III C-terminal domain-containing protein [Streptomyces morookaense]NVK78138.1 3-oxoacyl-ACP synthase [Streptomyces morookaense]GHF15467.1 3-oxoacyl-[acyl-carrier-protein] synthase 3 [Streptomyces morookaense]